MTENKMTARDALTAYRAAVLEQNRDLIIQLEATVISDRIVCAIS
jgi:hypothetical protein